MKSFILLLLLFTIGSRAQVSGFVVSDNMLIWENIFITSESNIPALIGRHPRLEVISSANNIYKGKGVLVKNTCPGTSSFMDNEFSFDFEIETGEGKYRVTVANIVYHKNKRNIGAEKYFLTKGAVKAGKSNQKDLECLETYLNRLFTNTMLYKNRM